MEMKVAEQCRITRAWGPVLHLDRPSRNPLLDSRCRADGCRKAVKGRGDAYRRRAVPPRLTPPRMHRRRALERRFGHRRWEPAGSHGDPVSHRCGSGAGDLGFKCMPSSRVKRLPFRAHHWQRPSLHLQRTQTAAPCHPMARAQRAAALTCACSTEVDQSLRSKGRSSAPCLCRRGMSAGVLARLQLHESVHLPCGTRRGIQGARRPASSSACRVCEAADKRGEVAVWWSPVYGLRSPTRTAGCRRLGLRALPVREEQATAPRMKRGGPCAGEEQGQSSALGRLRRGSPPGMQPCRERCGMTAQPSGMEAEARDAVGRGAPPATRGRFEAASQGLRRAAFEDGCGGSGCGGCGGARWGRWWAAVPGAMRERQVRDDRVADFGGERKIVGRPVGLSGDRQGGLREVRPPPLTFCAVEIR
jgi:hypothetical protein